MATPQAAGNKNAPKTGAPQAAKEPKVKRFSKKAKFVAGAATLTVTIRQGKSGDSSVVRRDPGCGGVPRGGEGSRGVGFPTGSLD